MTTWATRSAQSVVVQARYPSQDTVRVTVQKLIAGVPSASVLRSAAQTQAAKAAKAANDVEQKKDQGKKKKE